MKHPLMIFAVAALAVIGCLLCPQTASAALVETEDGWIEDPSIDTSWFDYLEPRSEYTISTEAQLRGLAYLVNEEQYLWKPNPTESFEDTTFVLTRDITLTESWTPIGKNEQITFAGTFDGKGHSIRDLSLETDDMYGGLYGHLSGKVRNLYLDGEISSTADRCGGIAGFVSEDGSIRNCTANVRVAGRNCVGGIAGYCKGGKVTGCLNYNEVIGASMVGGIVGECRWGTVKRCGNRGLIASNGAGSFNNGTGGVAGRAVSASTLNMCYNTGDILSSNEATGGVVGYTNSSGSAIRNCYSVGSIRIDDPQVNTYGSAESFAVSAADGQWMTGDDLPVYAGGIAGYVGSLAVVIENCYNAGRINGADYTGGIIGKCQNELYLTDTIGFSNNYYVKGSFDSAIAADRDNRPLKIRGAAKEVYDSAFGHLASSLGEAYMDDRAGDYGSDGYPVLVWQEEFLAETEPAVLKHIDPRVLTWLHSANLALETKGFHHGRRFMAFFDPDTIYRDASELKTLLQQGQ